MRCLREEFKRPPDRVRPRLGVLADRRAQTVGLVEIAHVRAVAYRRVDPVEAVVRAGIGHDVHRRAELFRIARHLHARRGGRPVVRFAAENQQRRVGPVGHLRPRHRPASRVEGDRRAEAATGLGLAHAVERAAAAVGPSHQPDAVRRDVRLLRQPLPRGVGILHPLPALQYRALLLLAQRALSARIEAVRQQGDVAVLGEQVRPQRVGRGQVPGVGEHAAAAVQHHDCRKRPRPGRLEQEGAQPDRRAVELLQRWKLDPFRVVGRLGGT